MAVVTVKAKAATNRDASPKVLSDSAYVKADLKGFIAQCGITSGDSTGSKYVFGSIPSNAIVHSVLANAPDIGTTTTMDIGLYKVTSADGTAGVVVDADFFKAAVVLNAGAITDSQVANGNIITLANSEKKVWELLGLTADPNLIYDVVGTLVGAADGTGVLQLKVAYGE